MILILCPGRWLLLALLLIAVVMARAEQIQEKENEEKEEEGECGGQRAAVRCVVRQLELIRH